MAIAFRSGANTAYGSRTNITIAAPAGIANGDILVAMIATGAASPPTPGTPAGWSVFGTDFSDSFSGFAVNVRTFWKRAASESGSYTFNHTSASSAGWIGCYSGAIASGTPLSATSTNTFVGMTSTGTGITTTAANSWLIWLGHDFADKALNLTPPSGMTERLDAVVIYAADQLIAAAGATGDRTMTNNNNGTSIPFGVRMVELLADTGGGGPSSGTLAITLDTATAAATGTILVKGTSAITLGAATGTLAGKVTVGGIVTTVLAPAVVVATGTVANSGTLGNLTATLGNATLAATGAVTTPARTGTLNVTLAPATLFAASLPQLFATLNVSLDQATLAARGHVPAHWTRESLGNARWNSDASRTARLTEDSHRRVTEDDIPLSRVIERVAATWTRQTSTSAGWTKELH